MAEKDYYKILGVSRDAGVNDIKKAYRKLAMEYHPDRNSGDPAAEEKFKAVGEAYSILSDPQKRQRYDQFGHAGTRGAGGFSDMGGFTDPFDIFREVFGSGFGDIFGMGGSGRRRSTVQKGTDLQIRLKLSLEEISRGVTKKIKIKNHIICDSCKGSGAMPGTSTVTCPMCHGSGEVSFRQGFFAVSQTCGRCHGEGKIIDRPCGECRGEGRVRGESTIEVEIPAGVAEGQYLTVRNAGNIGPRGGPRGDVLVIIEEKPHDYFERHGDDILYNLHLGVTQVALGGQVEVPTLNGHATISIAAGTQDGKLLRMRNKGLPHLSGSGSGDQLIRIKVWIPTKMSAREKELLEELSKSENMYPSKGDKSFFKRVKEAIL